MAFGPDKTLIAAVAGPGKKTLDQVLTPALAERFLAGDAGLYINVAALATRHADRIDQAREKFMAALDQAGQQAGNAATMDAAKEIYGGAFDALKYADALTLGLDFAPEGLHLAGVLTVKADSDAAKAIAAAHTGSASDLARLAADAAFYVYMNADSRAFDRLQGMGLRMLSPGGKAGPAQEQALAQFRALGRFETIGSAAFADGMRSLQRHHRFRPQEVHRGDSGHAPGHEGRHGPVERLQGREDRRGRRDLPGFHLQPYRRDPRPG